METVEATATQYTIRNLLAYTTYMIQVEALNGACSGTFNPAITVTTGEKGTEIVRKSNAVASPDYISP